MVRGIFMPDGARGSLRPTPDFQGLFEAAVAAIREQMEARLADRDAQIAGLFAERQELRRLVTDAQTAERIARDEAAGLRAELGARRTWGLRRRLRWALSRRR
jgi:hypothetical protein